MQRSRRAVLAAAVATAIPLAGCGTDGDDGPPTTDGTVTTAGETTTATAVGDPVPDGTPADGTSSVGPSTATASSTTLTGSPDPAATIGVSTHAELGDVLVGPNQRSVYAFDGANTGADADACTGGCTETWPLLTTTDTPTAGPDVEASVGTVRRGSGVRQITAAERPLYTFVGDETPGDARGQGVGGTWWVLRPDGSLVRV